MNEIDRVLFHKYVQEAANEIVKRGGLPPHPNHPHGRIPIAHIYRVIESVFGVPARDVPGTRMEQLKEVVDLCIEHRENLQIVRQIKHKYRPEIKANPPVLEKFEYE